MNTLMKLNSGTIDEIFKDCFVPLRNKTWYETISTPGITTPSRALFDFYTLESYRDTINALVNQLPRSFWNHEGDSFNNMNKDRSNNVWSRVEAEREKLVQLAIALNLVEIVEPREEWANLPGQRPSIRIVLR